MRRAERVEVRLPDRLPSAMLRARQAVTLEISLGPLADEVVLHGALRGASSAGSDARFVVLEPEQDDALNYLAAVQDGERKAAARGHRRLPSRLPVRWSDPRASETERTRLRDISRGGAFIVSERVPPVGERIEVTLDAPDGERIQLCSVVSWIRSEHPHRGFGVSFRPADPATARRLSEVVRGHEGAAVAGL